MSNAVINSVATGDVTVVAAPAADQFIRVLGYVLLANGNDTVTFGDGDGTVPLTGPFILTAQSGIAAAVTRDGWFDLSHGNELVINKAAAVRVGGHVRYEVYP